LYHERWDIEELYKISKVLIEVQDFHAQTERGVKQELYAHFVMITLSRIFSNHVEDDIQKLLNIVFYMIPEDRCPAILGEKRIALETSPSGPPKI
jgi:hypothetical protein